MTPETAPSDADDAWLQESLENYARSRDRGVRDEIARRTSWIAVRGARRFWDRGEPFDDLVQVANIGLLKAIDRFDPSLGVQFGAYATPTIVGELRRHFRDYTWSVHVPRRTKDMRASVNAARDDLTGILGRSPRVSEIADRLEVSADSVIGVLEANNAYRSYSLDVAGADQAAASDSKFEDVLNRELILGLLEQLPARQRKILYLRYFDELSQEQIAEQIGTSQVHVGRLIAASLVQLRRQIEDSTAK